MMKASATAFTLFSVPVTWLAVLAGCCVLLALYIVFGILRERKPRISLKKAFRDAFYAPLASPGATARFMVTEACLALICLAPLLLLTELPFQIPLMIAAGCWLLLMNPARVNAAAAMQDRLSGGSLCSVRLADPSRWGGKVWRGLIRAVLLPIWGVPLAAGLSHAYRLYKGEDNMDGFTMLQSVQDFGNGDVRTGIKYLLLILLGLVFILMIGVAFHSGARHAYALGERKILNGHRGMITLGWFCSTLVFMLPLWVSLGIVISRFMPMLNDPKGIFEVMKSLEMRPLLIILAAGIILTVPMLPARSMVTAAMVHQLKDREKSAP